MVPRSKFSKNKFSSSAYSFWDLIHENHKIYYKHLDNILAWWTLCNEDKQKRHISKFHEPLWGPGFLPWWDKSIIFYFKG